MVELSAKEFMDKFNSLPKSVQQAIIGTSSGWVTGFTLIKFGRSAGFSMGATILLLQLGHHYGYINIDWNTVNRDIQKAREQVEKKASTHIPDLSKKVNNAIKNNAVAVSSFVGGFFLGASTA